MENLKYLEVNLPKFLQDDIDRLIKGKKEKSLSIDCLYNEVQGSINTAFYGGEISEKQANYLRQKYVFENI